MVCLSQFGVAYQHVLISTAFEAFQRFMPTGGQWLLTPRAPPLLKVMPERWGKGLGKDSAVGFCCGWCCHSWHFQFATHLLWARNGWTSKPKSCNWRLERNAGNGPNETERFLPLKRCRFSFSHVSRCQTETESETLSGRQRAPQL